MCGIVGYIGKSVRKNLLVGLERLEYRGYDSAGCVVLKSGEFVSSKALGSVKKLLELVGDEDFDGLGIAHTRWATHGGITLENCHPHFSSNKSVALVHNGIIENYLDLKELMNDMNFEGQTDSEVVAKLLGENVSCEKLKGIMAKLRGSFAFEIVDKKQERIYFAKNKSPLYVAKNLIASDPSCFVGMQEEYFSLDDGEYGFIEEGKIVIMKNGELSKKTPMKLDFEFAQTDREKFAHFMIKEIYDSKKVLIGIEERYSQQEMISKVKEIDLERFNRIYFIACGTAYHASLMGGEYFGRRVKKDVFVENAGEIRYKNLIIDEHSLCFFVSQSGETADILLALDYVKSHGGKCVACVNTIYSSLAKKCEIAFPICAGQERAVASTKAYFGQCLTLFVISCILSGEEYSPLLKKFEEQLDYGEDGKIIALAQQLKNSEKLFFVGRGEDCISALEASLKMKEISYIFSFGCSSAELKHGSLALIENGVNAVMIASDESTFAKNKSSAQEIKSRGGKVFLVTSLDDDFSLFDFVIKAKPCPKEMASLQLILIMQKLAYFTSIARGNNPDKPRNLAKSVTVE